MLDHRSLPPVFESQHGLIWRLWHLWLGFITFGGCPAHLAYHVHKSGRKMSIIIIILSASTNNKRLMCVLFLSELPTLINWESADYQSVATGRRPSTDVRLRLHLLFTLVQLDGEIIDVCMTSLIRPAKRLTFCWCSSPLQYQNSCQGTI